MKPPFVCITGHYGAISPREFGTLEEAIDFATTDTGDYYVGEIRDGDDRLLYDHTNPFAGWVRQDESLPEVRFS